MIRFYAPDLAETLTLPESDSQHAIRVLRMREGDSLQAVDGRGHVLSCRIADPHPKRATVEILSVASEPLPWSCNITVGVAPTKHLDRMEWLVEKLTEIGVNRFVPLLCRNSERRELKEERLRKIAVSAMKQSLKAVLPEIAPMTPLPRFINETVGQKFFGYCDAAVPRVELAKALRPGMDTTLLIGPEGDFDHTEVEAAIQAGFQAVTLGQSRLRTETAALVGVTTIHVINQLHE